MSAKCLVAAALVLGLLCGCDGDDYQPAPSEVAPGPPLVECPEADYSPCDVREASCQERLLSIAACVRDTEAPKNLRIDVMSESQYADFVRDARDSAPYDGVLHYSRALSLFGLAPFDGVSEQQAVEEQVAFVAGQYLSSDKRVIIVDHGRPADSGITNSVLVHEFVHALQDASYDLQVWPGRDEPYTFDSTLAARTVIEGEAEFYGDRVGAPLIGLDAEQVDFESKFQAALDRSLERALEGTSLLTQSHRTIPYGMGALQAFHAWQEGGPRGIEPLWQDPPRTMQSVMAKLFGQGAPQAEGVSIPTPVVPTDLQPYTDDVLGAWGLCLVLTKNHSASALAADFIGTASSWRGDHLWVYTDAATQQLTYALWQVELETEDAARALSTVFEKLDVEHELLGARVFASYNMNGKEPSLPLSQWGRSWLKSGRD